MGTDNSTDNNGLPSSDAHNKRRRKKSIVWEHFTIETISASCIRARCKQCKKSFAYITGSRLAGTSHLKRHIALGICPESRRKQEKRQLSLYLPGLESNGPATEPPRKRYRAIPISSRIPFNQDQCNHEMAKMIILHEYPLHIVEHPGFVDFVRNLQPLFNLVTVDVIQGDILGVYQREKQNLMNILGGIPGQVNLNMDVWTLDQSLGYVFLTGYFIDADWKLQRRILNIIMVPCPDSEVAFNHAVVACLTDWNLDNKLFTVTLDESFASNVVMENLKGLPSIKNILHGQLVIGNCYARMLTRIAQDALQSMKETVQKVRGSVKYVKTSESIEEKFNELKEQLQVPSTKSLVIDDHTKWNTTYHMLVAASELKEVFSCLDTSDPNYQETPSMEEWKQVETLCTYLKLLFDATSILTAGAYPTANVFFHEVWKVHLELTHASLSEDLFVSNLTKPLQEKFDKYWKDTCLVLVLAVVMDPRFKMKLVEFSFSKIYGEDAETWIMIVDDSVHELFFEYVVQSLPPPTFVVEVNDAFIKTELSEDGSLLSNGDGLSDLDLYISEITSNQQIKSELDQYLEESLLPRVQDFDVLGWWKLNSFKYPTLSQMACDVLSIPLSTVAADSVFDTVNKKMDSYRSSLRPTTLEALICAKDWLQHVSSESPNAYSS